MQDLQLLLSEPSDGVLEFKLSGEIDIATVTPLKDAARKALASEAYSCLVFDLTGVTFMDSTALHVLAEANRRMSAKGGGVRLVCSCDNLLKVFSLTGLDQVLSIYRERSDAFALAA